MSASLGENIRNARKALKLSQEKLGEMIGANRVTISKYENNEYNPSVPALKRLADALQTTPAELTGDEAPETKTGGEVITSSSPQIVMMARAMEQMTPEQRDTMINLGRAAFAQYFGINDENT